MTPPSRPPISGSRRDTAASPVAARKRWAAEAMKKFVTILFRLGIPVEEILTGIQQACATLSQSHPRATNAAIADMDAAAHALTLWYSDAAYLNQEGRPRALPLRGNAPSLETLVQHADLGAGFEEVLDHLRNQSVLKEVGKSLYVPVSRSISFHGSGDPYHTRSFRTLNAMLGTLVHNGEADEQVPSWYEVFAVNSAVPVSAVPGFDMRTRRRADALLEQTDSDLLGLQRSWDTREPRVCIGLGIYRFEESVERDYGLNPSRSAAPSPDESSER